MLELIIIIFSISLIVRRLQRKQSVTRHTPPISPPKPPVTPVFTQKDVARQVNMQIYGTEQPQDRVTIYNRLLLTDRYQNMEKIAHELGISKYKVLREIKELKKQGHYLEIEIDEPNYRLIYPATARQRTSVQSAGTPASPAPPREKNSGSESKKESPPPARLSRSSAPAGEPYEEWMSVPPGKQVVRCSYCGADNLILEKQTLKKCSCYFCREEL